MFAVLHLLFDTNKLINYDNNMFFSCALCLMLPGLCKQDKRKWTEILHSFYHHHHVHTGKYEQTHLGFPTFVAS